MTDIQNSGIILIIVMIYLVILSLLALGALTASQLQLRMSNNIKDENRLFVCAEAALQQGKKILATTLSYIPTGEGLGERAYKCLLSEQASDYFHNKNATWWQTNACQIKVCQNYSTFYLIEKLSEQPCYKIANFPAGSCYFRMTVRASYHDDSYQTLLQSTILMPYKTKYVCPTTKIIASIGGQQSWKQIM